MGFFSIFIEGKCASNQKSPYIANILNLLELFVLGEDLLSKSLNISFFLIFYLILAADFGLKV